MKLIIEIQRNEFSKVMDKMGAFKKEDAVRHFKESLENEIRKIDDDKTFKENVEVKHVKFIIP